jgi:hypothetical protein
MKTLVTNNCKTLSITLALGTVFVCGTPAFASYDFWNWQPQKGAIHQKENKLEARLQRDYNRGLIDSNEYAQLVRDLDGITVQEDEFRVDHNGLGANDVKCMKAKLSRFQQNLNRAEGDKGCAVMAAQN